MAQSSGCHREWPEYQRRIDDDTADSCCHIRDGTGGRKKQTSTYPDWQFQSKIRLFNDQKELAMKTLASPFLALIWSTPALCRSAVICIVLALGASAAEIAMALSLVPILASIGVDAGDKIADFVGLVPPAGWLILFAVAAGIRSILNWLSSIQTERSTQELVVSLQSRLYRALAGAHHECRTHHASARAVTTCGCGGGYRRRRDQAPRRCIST
jgi:hypothetical protein